MATRKMMDDGQLAGPTGPAQAVDARAIEGRFGNIEIDWMRVRLGAVAPVRPAVRFPCAVQFSQPAQLQPMQDKEGHEFLHIPEVRLFAWQPCQFDQQPLRRRRLRRICVEQCEQRHLLSGTGQLLRHFVGNDAATGEPGDQIRATGLRRAHRSHTVAGNRLDAAVRPSLAEHASRLQAVDGLIGMQVAREFVVVKQIAADGVHNEQRSPGPALHDHQLRISGVAVLVADKRGERFDRPAAKPERVQRQSSVEQLFDLVHQLHCQQRVPAKIEEVVAQADRFALEEDLPDRRQVAFDAVAGSDRSRSLLARTTVGRRQCLAVDLAVGGEGQGRQLHEGRRESCSRAVAA